MKKFDDVILYGAGMVSELVLSRLKAQNQKDRVLAVAVTKKEKKPEKGSPFFGLPVFEIAELKPYSKTSVVLVATLPNAHGEIKAVLDKLGFQNQIYMTIKLYMELGRHYMEDFNQQHPAAFPEDSKAKLVFMASDNNKVSGAFLCLTELCSQLQTRGFGVLVVLPHHGSGASLLIQKGIPHTYILSKDWAYPVKENHHICFKIRFLLGLLSNHKAERQLIRLFQENHVDLVHCNTTFTYIGAVAAKKCVIPFVWHLRENLDNLGYRIFHFSKGFSLMQQADRVIAVSDYVKGLMPFDEKQICTIYDAVEAGESAVVRRTLFHQKTVKMILVGTLEKHKGQKEAIQACSILRNQKLLDFRLLLVGRGEEGYLHEIREMIRRLDLEKQVSLYGASEDVFALYHQSDLSLVCGGREAYGRVTIESQLAGCLVIGVDSGGTPELIQDGKTGYLYEAGNPEDLAKKIIGAVAEPEVSGKIARQGQVYAEANYTKEENVRQIVKVYEEILANNNRSDEASACPF